ncbi:MAG TPA: ATP-binding protein [Mycobacteriales bacterium]|nr:ATP-binding protein [Mycobacteriales bacterium]
MAKHLTIDRDEAGVGPQSTRAAAPVGVVAGQLAEAPVGTHRATPASPAGRPLDAAPPAGVGWPAPADRHVLAVLRSLSIVAGGLVVAIAAVVLVGGWWLGHPAAAAGGLPAHTGLMRPVAAVCLVLLGISALALGVRPASWIDRLGIACAVAGLAICTVPLVGYLAGVDLRFDQLLFRQAVLAALPGPHPGRLTVDGVVCCALLGVGQLAMRLPGGWSGLGKAAVLAGGSVASIDAYGAIYAGAVGGQRTAAGELPLVTAVALTVLTLGTLAARPATGLTRVLTGGSVGASIGRRMLVVALTVPVVLGTLPILARYAGLYGNRFGVGVLITGNVVAFAAMSVVIANAAARLESAGARAQQAARDGHALLTALIDNTSAVIYMRDLGGHYMLANREYERLFGLRREDLLGRTDHDLFPAEMAAAFRENDLAAVARGYPVQMEEVAPGDDGEHNYVTVKFPVLDEAGQAYAVCGISTDITDRTRAEAEVHRLNADLERRVRERTAELEASTKELDAFAYSVSHDLRAPLRSLDGFSQMLLDDYGGQLDEDGQDCLHRLQANTVRMGQIIDDLLNLSRATRVELKRNPVDLSELARSVLAELRQAEPDRTVAVDIAEHLTTTGDQHLLRLVLVNLFGNAWKFSARADPATVHFELFRDDGEERVFAVRDNGAGFNMEYAAKLFEPFQRLHSRGEFDGSGLGLAIVARILRRHGGRIWAEGAPGEGAAFYFTVTAPAEDRG